MVAKGGYSPPPTPDGLGASGVDVWRALTRDFEFHAGELVVLEQVCRTTDELADMEEALNDTGPLIIGSRGQRVINPLYREISTHRSLLDRLVLSLALPLDGEATGRRRTPQARQNVNSRWKGQGRRKGRLASIQPMTRDGA
jgi:hypothetical protein